MNKIAISLDIIRQYDMKLRSSGEETKLYAIDGYGERVSFRDLVLGYFYVFSNIYGESDGWYGYPNSSDPEAFIMHILWGEGIIGWNRSVTNPIIDIPKALKIYEQLSATASSYKDKHAREEVFKKLFYRTDSLYHNYFLDGTDQTNALNQYMAAGMLLYNENIEFYNYCKDKLESLNKLAKNEAKNVTVPTKLKYLFDSKPVATMYDAEPEDESYKDGLLNINSVVIQANQFYLTFLTSLEQILYQYTRQTFPLKLLGTMTNLYSSYVKLIVNYLKPYHARLIDKDPIIRFGEDLFESVMVGDQLEYNFTQQIFTDVYEWSFDNPYDWKPFKYDHLKKIRDYFYYGGKGDPDEEQPPFNGIEYLGEGDFEDETAGIHYQLNDEWRYNHRIDKKLWYVDRFYKDLFEDFNVIVDSKEQNIDINIDDIPVEIYPSILNTTLNKYDCLSFDFTNGTLENLLDRDLVVITKNYCQKGQYRLSNIKTCRLDSDQDLYLNGTTFCGENSFNTSDNIVIKNINFNTSSSIVNYPNKENLSSKIAVLLDDICHIHIYRNDRWEKIKLPIFNDIYNNNRVPPIFLGIACQKFNNNEDYLNVLKLPSGYHNFIKFMIYIPAHSKAILPKVSYECRLKHYF